MQRRFNSVEKFTEMHLSTTIKTSTTKTMADAKFGNRPVEMFHGRSHENLLSNYFIHPVFQTNPALTEIFNSHNKNGDSRPFSRTAFLPHKTLRKPQYSPHSSTHTIPISVTSQNMPQQQLNPNVYDSREYGSPRQDQQPQHLTRSQSSLEQRFPSALQGQTLNLQEPRQSSHFLAQQNYLPPQKQQAYSEQPQQQVQNFVQGYPQQQLLFQGGYQTNLDYERTNGPLPTTSSLHSYQPSVVPRQTPNQRSYSHQRPESMLTSKSHEKIAKVCSNSNNTLQFAENLETFFKNNIPGFIWVTLALLQIIFGLISILIATFNFSLCNIEPKIPVYLLLSGLILIVNGSTRLCFRIPSSSSTSSSQYVVHNGRRYKQSKTKSTFAFGTLWRYLLEGTILLIIVIVIIFGCVWVYGAKYVQFERYRFERNYCNYTLYNFAWWSVTTHLVVFSIIIITLLTVLLYGAMVLDNS